MGGEAAEGVKPTARAGLEVAVGAGAAGPGAREKFRERRSMMNRLELTREGRSASSLYER